MWCQARPLHTQWVKPVILTLMVEHPASGASSQQPEGKPRPILLTRYLKAATAAWGSVATSTQQVVAAEMALTHQVAAPVVVGQVATATAMVETAAMEQHPV
ncbi:hypothetical protein WL1483_372 [Aeromonas schubertii]|uniref:Uncharacterized protein n=1 Tax=Aeromonas schubertii TaxID=652 RepID=A0A0S2SDR3_9GAMM|nr:hypothetical protein WL1483_372 [Aeromonas schubertii]